MLSTNQFKNGNHIEVDGTVFKILEFQHVKPGKGGAFVRTKLRNVRTKAVVERTFRAAEQVEQAVIDKREMQYLYRDGQDYVFMDNASYDQLNVPESSLGEAASYLKEGDSAVMQMYDNEIVGVDLPAAVELSLLLEWACGVYWHAAAIGVPRTLGEEALADVREALVTRAYRSTVRS